MFGFSQAGNMYAPVGYTQGDNLSGNMVFNSTTLANLNLSDGQSGIMGSGGNAVNWSASSVPEPSSALLCLVATGLFLRRRR